MKMIDVDVDVYLLSGHRICLFLFTLSSLD